MKLLDRVSNVGTRKHLAASTIECYRRWVREFLAYRCREGHWRHPAGKFKELFPKAVDGRASSSGFPFSIDEHDAVDQVL